MRQRLTIGLAAMGITNARLARELKTSPSVITRILAGDQPGRKHLPVIATLLGCTVEWLNNGTGPPPTWWRYPADQPPTIRVAETKSADEKDHAIVDLTKRCDLVEARLAKIEELLITLALSPAPAQQPADRPGNVKAG